MHEVSALSWYVLSCGMDMPLIRPLWESVLAVLNDFGDWSLVQDPGTAWEN